MVLQNLTIFFFWQAEHRRKKGLVEGGKRERVCSEIPNLGESYQVLAYYHLWIPLKSWSGGSWVGGRVVKLVVGVLKGNIGSKL